MWVWQSQAPGGTSKFTGVDGCAAVAKTGLSGIVIPAAMEASRTPRRVNIGLLPVAFFALLDLALRERIAHCAVNACAGRINRAAFYCPDGVRSPCQASRT